MSTETNALDQQAVDVATCCGISLYHARGLVGAAARHGVTPLGLLALIAGVNDERTWRHAPMVARVQECHRRIEAGLAPTQEREGPHERD